MKTADKFPDQIKSGTVLINNDPRVAEDKRIITVEAVRSSTLDGYTAHYQANTRWAKIKFNRIFLDGKPRHQGYNARIAT